MQKKNVTTKLSKDKKLKLSQFVLNSNQIKKLKGEDQIKYFIFLSSLLGILEIRQIQYGDAKFKPKKTAENFWNEYLSILPQAHVGWGVVLNGVMTGARALGPRLASVSTSAARGIQRFGSKTWNFVRGRGFQTAQESGRAVPQLPAPDRLSGGTTVYTIDWSNKRLNHFCDQI